MTRQYSTPDGFLNETGPRQYSTPFGFVNETDDAIPVGSTDDEACYDFTIWLLCEAVGVDEVEFIACPVDDAAVATDDTIAPPANDDDVAAVVGSLFLIDAPHDWAQAPPDQDDEFGGGSASIDDVDDLPAFAEEWIAVVVDQDDECGWIASTDDVADLPSFAEEWTAAAVDQDDDIPPAPSCDDAVAVDFADPLEYEYAASPLAFPDDETGETPGAGLFEDVFTPAVWLDVAEESEATASPLDDAPVITDQSIFLAASDDDEIAAAFIPPAAEEWSQAGTPEDDPNFAVPFGALAADDVFDLPADAEEWSSTPPDQVDDTAPAPSIDDVDDLPAPAEEWSQGPADAPTDTGGALFSDDDVAAAIAVILGEPVAEWSCAPLDDAPVVGPDLSVVATSFDDDAANFAARFILSIEPGEFASGLIDPTGQGPLDGFRIFERSPRATFYGPERLREFLGYNRRRVFFASLYLT